MIKLIADVTWRRYLRSLSKAEPSAQPDGQPSVVVDPSGQRIGHPHTPPHISDAGRYVLIVDGRLPQMVDEAEKALVDSEVEVYQRSGMLVRPAHVPIKIADGDIDRGVRLIPVSTDWLIDTLTRIVPWMRFDGRTRKLVQRNCPSEVAVTLLARVGQWNFPVLTGLISAPTLRPDGSVLEEAGYDTRTGLLFVKDIEFAPVPEMPSKEDGQAAIERIADLFETFPFSPEEDISVVLSMLLSALIRSSLDQCPMHAATAPVAGSGKSLLVDVVSIIVTGARCAVVAPGEDEEELEKRLVGELMAGSQLVNIDNIERPLGGVLLCQMLMQREVKLRMLGKSGNHLFSTDLMMTATGNNLCIAGDMTRRTLLFSLDAGVERPELRQFDIDIRQYVTEHRAEIVVDALTVLRAYAVSNRAHRLPAIGGYEEWSKRVREAIVWLGYADPAETMERARATDPKLNSLKAVISSWWTVFGQQTVRASELIEKSCEIDHTSGYGTSEKFIHPELREAICSIAGVGAKGVVSSDRLGRWIKSNANRIVRLDGGVELFMSEVGKHQGTKTWKLSRK